MRTVSRHSLVCLVALGLGACNRSDAPLAADKIVQEPAAAEPAPKPAASAPAAGTYGDRTRQFLEAADKGRVSLLMELLTKGVDINDKDDEGYTALHKAVAKGHRSAVVTLLVRGADMAEKDAKGRTPLMAAAEAGQADIVALLLTPDSVKNLAGDVMKGAAADALKAALPDLDVRLSVTRNSAVDQTDQAGQTALMKAAAGGHTGCVNALLFATGSGANSARSQSDKQGRTALMLAAAAGHADVVEAMCLTYGRRATVADYRRADQNGMTAEQLTEAAGHKNVVAVLRRELLVDAAAEGDVATCKQLLEAGPADLAAGRAMSAAASAGATAVVQLLMEKWKDRLVEDKLRLMGVLPANEGGTALHAAAANGHLLTIQTLLNVAWWKDKAVLVEFIDRGNSTNNSGATASSLARFARARPEVAEAIDKKRGELTSAGK